MALPKISALFAFSFCTYLTAKSHMYLVWVSLILHLSFSLLERHGQRVSGHGGRTGTWAITWDWQAGSLPMLRL